jgi:hypothetical protein
MIFVVILLVVSAFCAFRRLRDAFFTVLGAVILIGLSTCVLRADDWDNRVKAARKTYDDCLTKARSENEEEACRDQYIIQRAALLTEAVNRLAKKPQPVEE